MTTHMHIDWSSMPLKIRRHIQLNPVKFRYKCENCGNIIQIRQTWCGEARHEFKDQLELYCRCTGRLNIFKFLDLKYPKTAGGEPPRSRACPT